MNDRDKRWEENKQLFLFLTFAFTFTIGLIFLLIKDKLGLWLFKIAYYDLLIGEKLYEWFGFFKQIPVLKKIFFKAIAVDFDWGSLKFLVTTNDGNSYYLISYTIRYLWPVNLLIVLPIFTIEILILFKFSRLSSKFKYEGIKNKQISLYFNDKKLQNFKRKVIKMWDTINQKEIKQFAFNDYFPPYFPEDEKWFNNYIENSIYYSMHQINTSEERYKDIENVWNSILEEHKVKEKGKKKLPIIKQYQFKRFEYMDKEDLLEDVEIAKKELSIFITDKNRNEEGVPYRNLFNYKNSNQTIKDYIKKYYREYYLENEEIEELNSEGENFHIDWTHLILEDLKVYFEVKLFRKDEKFNKTYFNLTKKNQVIKTPLLLLEEFDEEKKRKEIEEELIRKGISSDENKIKERLEKIKKEYTIRNMEKIEQAKKYYNNLKYLAYGISDPKKVRFKQPVLKRTYIMTPFDGMRKLTKFKTKGIQIPAEILNKYIVEDYEESLRKQIKELKDKIKEYSSSRSIFKSINTKEEEIENLKALVAELESRLDKENQESRKAKIIELLETHKFEETYLISLWEYGMTLVNLPTGRLSIIKKDNIVLWYALTSLGRPFTFKAGVPIEVMRQIEIEKHSTINKLKDKYEDPTKDIKDFIDKETLNELKRNSPMYDEYDFSDDDDETPF